MICMKLSTRASTSFLSACSLELIAGKVYLFKFFPVFTLIFGEPSLSFRKHREKSLRLTDSLVPLIQVSLNIDIVDNYFPRL